MLDILLYDGFGGHADDAAGYAAELEAAAAGEIPAKHLAQFAKVATHAVGEHLGDWPRAARLAGKVLADKTPAPETAKAWGHLSVARLLAGDAAGAAEAEVVACQGAGVDFRGMIVEIKFLLVAALVGTGRTTEAAAIYAGALGLAEALGDAAPSRAIAVASNNLATELLEAPTRTEAEAALMRTAADASHAFWRKCGDWINDARGHYLQALVANVLGEPQAALRHADTALAMIDEHGGAEIDATFLTLARAHALSLLGDAEGADAALEISDSDAGDWDDTGLITWYAEERARMLPAAAPFSPPESAPPGFF